MKAYIKGANQLLVKLIRIQNAKDSVLPERFEYYGELVRDDAALNAPANSGGLKRSIFPKTIVSTEEISTIVSTTEEHALYVEFGTGPKGQENHAGISPKISPTYTSKGWIIPASAISPQDAERYHMIPYERFGEVIGYFTQGQAAQPFLYPALKNNEMKILRDITKELNNFLKRTANDK